MQTKLTLRMDDAVIRKAKRIARERGTSVSRIFSDFVTEADDEKEFGELGELTVSMIGALRGADIQDERREYNRHLEDKHR